MDYKKLFSCYQLYIYDFNSRYIKFYIEIYYYIVYKMGNRFFE